ncbi:restriction endonuclease subunit S [Cronobacter dublinensis]|uniref:restriction endonuclease subunit S n=1 Tax=Cronobacter dublinensis TaxID=413497 RepID=UPI00300DDFD6
MSGGKLPEGWVDTQLGNIIELKYGKSLAAQTRDGFGFPVYGSNGVVGKHSIPLINKSGLIVGRKGSYGVVNKSVGPFFPIDTTYYIDDFYNQPLEFLFYYLSFLPLTKLNRSTAIPGLNRDDAYDLNIALPPLAEQKIIAEKLDTLLAQVDSTKARLEQIPQILKRFRQAVLIAAFTKKLTESSEFTEKKISDVCSFQNGFAFKSSWFSKTGSYQVIKLANIRDGYLFLENAPAYVNEEQGVEFSKFSPNIGDVLISMTGTRFKKDYGFGCIMTQKHKALINQRVGRLIPIKASILPEYLFLFVRSELFREQFFKGETGGVNQGNVGSQHIQSILINVPPFTEQHEIVRRVEQLFAYTDTIEKQVNNALALVNSLTQSLLAKAFRGELTAQWRAENPDLISGESSAAALLERIKAERAASSGKKAARKKA